MIPGSVTPLIWGQGDPLDELGKIYKSVRYRLSAGPTVRRATTAAGNRKTLVFATWVKRSEINAVSQLFTAAWIAGSSAHQFRFETTNELTFFDGSTGLALLKTNALYRDTSAFYHVIFAIDTTQAVQANRGFIIVNGDAASLQTANIALNFDTAFSANGMAHGLGCAAELASVPVGGYMAHPILIDGYPLGINSANWSASNIAALFGVKHPRTGQWRTKTEAAMKAIADAGGPNSFFLPLKDSTSLATLFADASGKGNDWTAINISLTNGVTYDSMLDTPTNVFPVINPIFASCGLTAGTITDGGLKFASSTTYHFTPCTIPLPEYGKWECEFIPQDTVGFVGLADLDNGSASSQDIGAGFGWYGSSLYTGNVSIVQSGLATMAANDKITIAVDMDARVARWYQNGVLRITQALTAGKRYAFACGDYYAPGATSCFANFGQYPITNHVAGYLPLCSKNLKFPPIPKASSAFVAVTDTGANIQATLAAARSGWASYIEIFKRRDAAEGWRWRFSDDAANYLDSSSTAAKAAFPALVAGGSYVGYALKVSGVNGVATGRLVHTNGVADTVTDNLGNVRKAILLKNEATGTWYFYHPDLTAGKLLYLEQTAAETTDATLGTVLSNSFVVAAALASGTYRWIAFAEIDGFLKLGKHAGNSSADGPFNSLGFCPVFGLTKSPSAAGTNYEWYVFDSVRDKENPIIGSDLELNSTYGEGVSKPSYAMDFDSSGQKLRSYSEGINYASGYSYVWLMIAAFTFRYANAR